MTLKKAVSLLCSAMVLCCVFSCGKKQSETSDNAAPHAVYSLKTEDKSLPDNFSQILCLDSCGDRILVFGQHSDNTYSGFLTDSELNASESFSFEPADGEKVITASLTEDNKKVIMTYMDEKTLLHSFASDGSEEQPVECADILYDELNYAGLIIHDGYYINVNNEYISYIDSSGAYKGRVGLNGNDIFGFAQNSKGEPTVILSSIEGKTTVAEITGTSINNETECDELSSTILAACRGTGGYDIAAVFYDGMYGLKSGSWVKLSDFMENDFSAYNVSSLIMTSENSFIVCINKDEGTVLKILTQRSAEELSEQETVKIALLPGSDISDYYVKEYNSSQSKYRVELVDYTKSADAEENIRNFKNDIISGNAPDIIPFSAYVPIDTFGSKESIFVDLYSMIDNDPDISRDDFVNGFLEGVASDGKLLMIAPSFKIKTIECKNKYLNGLKSWDYDQMMNICNANIDDISLSVQAKYGSYTEAFMDVITYYPFVDYESASCSFDSNTFISLLEFFRRNKIGTQNPSGWDSTMVTDSFKNDEIMLRVTEVDNYLSLYAIEKEYFNEPTEIIGYPTANGSTSFIEVESGYSILTNSDVKDGAWDFIKTEFLSDKYYMGTEGSYIFPVMDKYIDKQISDLNTNLAKWQSEGENCSPMSDEQMKEYSGWVRTNARNIVKKDYNVEGILREELDAFFNNERSAEDTVRIIQNRVDLYLSEHYQ